MGDDLNQFGNMEFPKPLPPMSQSLRTPALPQAQPAPLPGVSPQPQQGGGGLIEYFKSLFHRQTDLDNIMKQAQPGLRSDATPAQNAFPNINGTMYDNPGAGPSNYGPIAGVRG